MHFSQGYAYVEDQNPADYLIKSLASVIDAPEATNKLCSAFKTSEYYIKMMTYIKVENEKEVCIRVTVTLNDAE